MNKMTDQQKENTFAFFKEFQLLRQLEKEIPQTQDDSGDDSPAMRAMLEDTVRAFDPFPRTGEIRLLSQPEKITYAAILPWDHRRSLVIPLSHFRNPATDHELAAEDGDKNGLFMQVYQCWNARTVNNTLLARSWIAGHITQNDQDRLNRMIHSLPGEDVPPEIRALSGAPVFRKEDPRHDYMRRETEYFAELDAEDLAIENWISETEKISSRLFFKKIQKKIENWISETEKISGNIPFPAAEYFLQAAAGKDALSGIYTIDPDGNTAFLTGIELEAFEPVSAGTEIPRFSWFCEKLPAEYPDWNTVLFRHSGTGTILGSGYLHIVTDGIEIVLQSPIGAENTPAIHSPGEIQIILQGK